MELVVVFFVALGILIGSIVFWLYVNVKRNREYSDKNLKRNRATSILERYDK